VYRLQHVPALFSFFRLKPALAILPCVIVTTLQLQRLLLLCLSASFRLSPALFLIGCVLAAGMNIRVDVVEYL
jgi:hypothetical protein